MNKQCAVRRQHVEMTFRKWARKSYSVFQSMHKVIRIAFLSVSYLLFAIPSNAQKNMIIAPHDSINPVKGILIDEVVVSAQRAPVTFSQAARIVNVIEKDEIQNAPIQSIQDLIEYAPGVDIRQRGGLGVQADVSIRGSSFDQVLILLNGVSINDPQTGHHNLNLPVSLDAIDRIEILEGPASRIYGLNAFSGAINIITGTGKKSSITTSVSGGEYGYFDGSISGNLSAGKTTNFISVDHRRSDGYVNNTDFKLTDAYYSGKFLTSDGVIELQAGHSGRSFGANSFYTPVYADQYENTRTTFTSLKFGSNKKFHLTPIVYWRRNQDRFELFRSPIQPPAWYLDHNYHLTDVIGFNLNTWFTSALGKTSAGIDFRNENILSTVLGKPLSKSRSIPGESGKEFVYTDNRSNLSLFLEHSIYLENFSLSGGMMANLNSHLDRWNFYPGIDLGWRITAPLKWHLSLNKSVRIPTFTDLYYNSPTNSGNPLLKSEEATAAESGFKYRQGGINGHVVYFHRWGRNMIDWIQRPGETIWKAENLTEINTDGVEIFFKVIPDIIWSKNMIIKSLNFSWSYLHQGKESGSFSSKYVLDYLKYKAVVGVTHTILKNINASWQIFYQDRNGTYTQWEGSGYGNEVPYKPLWLINSRIYWKNKGTNLYLEVSNLSDQKYFDYGNVEQPGRWLKLGIKHQIEF